MSNVMNKGTAIVGFVLSFVTGAGFMYALDRGNQGKDEASADKAGGKAGADVGGKWTQDAPVPVSSDDPILGPKSAQVTLVIFSDYQCPYCKRVEPTLKDLQKQYGDKIRFVWKDVPLDFHKNALPAATAGRVAFMLKGSDGFWKMHDKLFENNTALSDENYVKWLGEIGISKADYEKNKAAAEARVKAGLEESKKLGIQGTPNFMIDGEPLTGAQPIDKFKQTIDAHLKKAGELKAKGTTDAELYVAMTKSYFKAAPEAAEAKGDEKPAEEPDDFTVWKVEVGDSAILGKADAPITIVTFSEFQCPYCKRIEPTLQQVRKDYGDKVRLVFKLNPLPFHNRAKPTAQFAFEALAQKGGEGFWKAHDKLFDLQPKLEDADLEGAAKDLGLDWGKVSDAMKTEKWKDKIAADMDQGEALQVRGTPHSFVNGRVVNGAVPYEKFKKIIDQELPKAEAKIKAGTAAANVYAEIIKDGKIVSSAPLPVPAYSPWKGAKDAKVVIQIFSDFQCPFCKRGEFDTPGPDGKVDPNAAGMKVAWDKYSDKIKVVWRNFPLSFHNRAEPAAQFTMCAFKQKGNDTFWKIHDELFAIQPKLEDADLEGVAKKFGVDWAVCKKEMDDHKYKTEIDADMKDGGSIGVTGTPAFIINGKSVVGAQPFEAFQKAIDAALAKAK